LFLLASAGSCLRSQSGQKFRWPNGKRAAVSLTFDDARASQIDVGIALLGRCEVRATFYLSPSNMGKRLAGWKEVAAAGYHEIGNHSYSHPCTANFSFSRSNGLEDYSRERMEADIDRATEHMRQQLGVTPVSFAYPCGQKFFGRGVGARSYVPLIAKRFLSGRGYLDEAANDPAVCDLANLMGTGFDGLKFDEMRNLVEAAAAEGRWLIFAGHEIGAPGRQTVIAAELESLCRYLRDPGSGIWTDTAGAVSKHVEAVRRDR
jgi:peptidoglycan/xylan/chitin deacetylase (PgdA/CDA1 family)